jgi:Zincin-like metallopeptidase
MRLSDFEAMVRRLCGEVPPDFFDGVAEVVVSPRTVTHPDREDVFTMGECESLPVQVGSGVEGLQSRIVLYHGSFAALARQHAGHFDWAAEAWETLTHELRHHLEWRARAPDLEDFDWAVEHNYARQEGESFDLTFFLSGEPGPDASYRVEEDFFLDQLVGSVPAHVTFSWRGRQYRIQVPQGAALPCFLSVEGVAEAPEGELVVVLRRPPGVRDLLGQDGVWQGTVHAVPYEGILPPDGGAQ